MPDADAAEALELLPEAERTAVFDRISPDREPAARGVTFARADADAARSAFDSFRDAQQ